MWCGHLYEDRLGGIWHHKLRIPRRHAKLHMLLAKIVFLHASDAKLVPWWMTMAAERDGALRSGKACCCMSTSVSEMPIETQIMHSRPI